MPLSKQAAMDFIARLRPGDVAEVVSFDTRVEVLQPMTSDRALLEAAIQRMRASGSTALYNAVYIVLRQLDKVRPQTGDDVRRQVIVVLSDGEDTSSLVTFEHLLDSAKRSQTVIYAVGLGLEEHDEDHAVRWRIWPSTTRPGNRRAPLPAQAADGSRRCLHADRERADQSIRGRVFVRAMRDQTVPGVESPFASTPEPACAHSRRLLRSHALVCYGHGWSSCTNGQRLSPGKSNRRSTRLVSASAPCDSQGIRTQTHIGPRAFLLMRGARCRATVILTPSRH